MNKHLTAASTPVDIKNTVNAIINGALDITGNVVLLADSSVTYVNDRRVGINTKVFLSPITVDSAIEFSSGSLYILSKDVQKGFTIAHSVLPTATREFWYLLVE